MKLLKAEQKLADEVTDGLDHLPLHLTHRVGVYSKMLHQWEKSAGQMSRAKDPSARYKLAQECAMFAKQFEVAGQAIERERNRQAEERRLKQADEDRRRGKGGLKAYEQA